MNIRINSDIETPLNCVERLKYEIDKHIPILSQMNISQGVNLLSLVSKTYSTFVHKLIYQKDR